ncbi:glutathione S-transferase family protein [Polaromonas sp.]|uniref:glutathione S-transferase family protein n=1 Tax=Polaromonas sp. TaxID=1869339 RepID=UPI00326729E2
MIQLHFSPSSAAMVPHILLHELGVPFEKILVDTSAGAHRSEEYRKLNPNGLIPTLVDGELVLYETAAICLHLCDTHPEAGLAPAVGSVERAHFYKWLMWLTNTLQATLIVYFYTDRWMNPGNAAGVTELKSHAEARVGQMLDQLDAELARLEKLHGQPWLLGAKYSAVDIYTLTLCRWTRNFASSPARSRPHLGPYLQRVLARPAVIQAFTDEGLAQPWI